MITATEISAMSNKIIPKCCQNLGQENRKHFISCLPGIVKGGKLGKNRGNASVNNELFT